MKTFKLFTLTLSVIFLISCKSYADNRILPINYTIVLDLSDRLLEPGQSEKDIVIIEEAFKQFESKARKNLILSSRDRFSIKLIPQKGSKLNWNLYENKLQISLDKLQTKDKNIQISLLRDSLHHILKNLYKEAYHGPKTTDYFGVDIWSYFHNNNINLTPNNYNNSIIVITDGYFDFENNNHIIYSENKYSNTNFINKLSTTDWKSKAEKNKVGLIPIIVSPETKWIIAGFNSKKQNDILQIDKLEYFWTKWLIESGSSIKNINVISNSSEIDLKNKITDIL